MRDLALHFQAFYQVKKFLWTIIKQQFTKLENFSWLQITQKVLKYFRNFNMYENANINI